MKPNEQTSWTYARITVELIIRIANYQGRLDPPGKHFLTVIVLHLFMA